MNIPLLPQVRTQMERDLTNLAKDMLRGEQVRQMTLRNGRWSKKIAVKFAGIEDDNGMPAAMIEALSHIRDDMYGSFAVAKLIYDVDGHITKSPGKKAFSKILFDPPADRGFELARAFTKWVDDWIPIHHHCLMMGRGDAFAGARVRERATDRFVRTPTVIDLSQAGVRSDGPSLARLMLSPIVAKAPRIDEELQLDRVFSLHRTMPEGSAAADVVQQVEEELLVGATVARELSGQSFTMFDAVFHRELDAETSRSLLRALVLAALTPIKGMPLPKTFRSPFHYAVLSAGLGAAGTIWDGIEG